MISQFSQKMYLIERLKNHTFNILTYEIIFTQSYLNEYMIAKFDSIFVEEK